MGDALAEDRLLHELGVGVQHVVVAGEPGEDHQVGLGHRAPGRLVLLAERDLLEVPTLLAHEGAAQNRPGPDHAGTPALERRARSGGAELGRTSAAPAASARSLPRATSRESGTMPQLVHG